MREYDPVEIEKKWQNKWEQADIYKTEKNEDKDPYYIIFAYPGISGFLHLGHMRCYSYTDILARYKRMSGYNVLFPAGTHPTGNQAISLSKKIQEGDEERIEYLLRNGASKEDLERLKNPMKLVDYFNEVYKEEYWKKFGISIDFDYFTYTIREDYKQFIKWQFKKLNQKGLLVQKPYFGTECVRCGPVAVDPSETDLSKGGTAEKQEYTLLKFEYRDKYITAATLRPETVFGQTNLWVDPEEVYVVAEVEGEEWILSEEAAEKLSYQKDSVEIVERVKGEEMIGDYATAPAVHKDIIILPASFTDPDVGTGIVTSVPSDAPYDWIALKDIKENEELLEKYDLKEKIKDLEPIEIIDSDEWGKNPAKKIIEEMDIQSQDEVEKLEEATQKIYKAGFHTGTMLDTCEGYAGMRVQQAKEQIKEDLIETGEADVIYDLSEEVICRCGEKVVVGKIPDQWFIKYSDFGLTEDSKRQAKNMFIKPQSYSDNLPDTIEWFQDRSCARLGNWMGTEFPIDNRWIIEAIADSTLYPAFYIVAKYYNEDRMEADQMTEEFFDYVYLGKGEPKKIAENNGIDVETLEDARGDFSYWYPIDINLGGKEHMTVHFPAFLMNHVGVLNEKDWPKGIFVNWWLISKGGKISKSKGGAEPIPDAAEKYGVDTLRLFYAHSSSPFVDKEWSEEEVFNYRKKLKNIWNQVNKMAETKGNESKVDDYLKSVFNRLLKKYTEIMDDYEIRKGANVVFYDIPSELDWYFKRGGSNKKLLKKVGKEWIKLMAPFTPHIAEELGQLWDIEYVNKEEISVVDESQISKKAEAEEEYIMNTRDDIRQILNVADVKGDKIHLYIAPKWKEKALEKILENPEEGMGIMSTLLEEIDAPSDKLSSFTEEVFKELKEKGEKDIWKIDIDEFSVLKDAKHFLEDEFEADIRVYMADDEERHDPVSKASKSMPRRPAIYVE